MKNNENHHGFYHEFILVTQTPGQHKSVNGMLLYSVGKMGHATKWHRESSDNDHEAFVLGKSLPVLSKIDIVYCLANKIIDFTF